MKSTNGKNPSQRNVRSNTSISGNHDTATTARAVHSNGSAKPATAIENCVKSELSRYYDMLDGEEPSNLHRMVMRQAEYALISSVMHQCGGNQTRASEWLGISRGNLRSKLAAMNQL